MHIFPWMSGDRSFDRGFSFGQARFTQFPVTKPSERSSFFSTVALNANLNSPTITGALVIPGLVPTLVTLIWFVPS